ncbi:universal stress protein [Fibrella sp. HMF5335]|uniref:Universal stress protein n=1 Tax=Fibrella rubiginis TaxID=2817060 RepID=A0A939GCS8_9BACT|nr:universal stress protein [Fibrella rubiginis]MBO0935413.1 universal stress protein [Fibrella rubiginis]
MYKILLLTDFSAASRHAIAYAQALFSDTAANFCLLNAYPIEPAMEYGAAFLLAEGREAAEQNLHEFRQAVTETPQPDYHTYRTLVALGEPIDAVARLLETEHIDLIVVGATGAGNSERTGSVATGLLRLANTHVLVVPVTAPIRPLQQIVLATDYRSVNDAQSLVLLTDLASRKAALLTLLTIENPKKPDSQPTDASRRYVQKAFDGVQTDLYTIHDTDVRHGIQAYLDLHPVDMLVLLPHHKSLFDVLRKQSVSRSVAYHPPVPVLALYDELTPADSPDIDHIPFATYL